MGHDATGQSDVERGPMGIQARVGKLGQSVRFQDNNHARTQEVLGVE